MNASTTRILSLLTLSLVAACGGKVGGGETEGDGGGIGIFDDAGGSGSGSGTGVTPPSSDGGIIDPPPPLDGGITPFDSGFDVSVGDGGVIVPKDASFDGGICVPVTCEELFTTCGVAGDGCGGVLMCGPCVVDSGICNPRTCDELGANCGTIGDGCGGLLECGTCAAPNSCGGAMFPNVCGSDGNIDASGTWTGMWQVGPGSGLSGMLTLELSQQGVTLTGTAAFANEPCFGAAALTGTLTGSTWSGTMTEGPDDGALTGLISGNTMKGSVMVTGGCGMVAATFEASR